MAEDRDQMPEVRRQMSEVRRQMSEVREKPELLVISYWLSASGTLQIKRQNSNTLCCAP